MIGVKPANVFSQAAVTTPTITMATPRRRRVKCHSCRFVSFIKVFMVIPPRLSVCPLGDYITQPQLGYKGALPLSRWLDVHWPPHARIPCAWAQYASVVNPLKSGLWISPVLPVAEDSDSHWFWQILGHQKDYCLFSALMPQCSTRPFNGKRTA